MNSTSSTQLSKQLFPLACALTALIAVATAFWAPTLFDGKSLIHGDSLLHGLSLWRYNEANINTPQNLVWDKYTYGGHPLFAEGQGGFAFPLHLLLARSMNPELANNFAHWLEMILAGVAIIGLGRLLKLSHWACGFAGLAAIFSSYWIQMQQNMTIGAAAMSIPWILWAGEYWLQRRSWLSGLFLGSATAVGVLAGYPHCVHGAILYLCTTIAAQLFIKPARADLLANISQILKTGALAVAIAIGLSAIQLLPLLELTQYSHRSAGTAAFYFHMPLSVYLRGLFYTLKLHEMDSPNFTQVIGSLFICFLFTLPIFFKLSARMKGHAIAALLLLNLGMGGTSPLTQLIYNFHLIPGIHYFRHMMPYFLTANIGVGLIAATSIDNLVHLLHARSRLTLGNIYTFICAHKIKITFFVIAWAFAFKIAGFDVPISAKNLAIVIAAFFGAFALAILRRPNAIPALFLLLLVLEITTMKLHEFHFGDSSVLQKPATVSVIESDPRRGDYKFYSASFSFLYSLGSPTQTDIEQKAKTMFANLCGLSNLGWNIPSMMGALALPLKERVLLDPIFEDEVNGRSNTLAGMRFIDLLSVRYIAADAPLRGAALTEKYHDSATGAWLLENAAAKPRFQIYANYVLVNSSEEALNILQTAKEPILTIERPPFAPRTVSPKPIAPASAEDPQIQFNLIEDEPTRYRLKTRARKPGWLFLADANYPGWRATIDNAETTVFTAQMLGKAIAIPTGDHEVEFSFRSNSYELGRNITLATLTIAALGGIAAAMRERYEKRRGV